MQSLDNCAILDCIIHAYIDMQCTESQASSNGKECEKNQSSTVHSTGSIGDPFHTWNSFQVRSVIFFCNFPLLANWGAAGEVVSEPLRVRLSLKDRPWLGPKAKLNFPSLAT